MTARSPLEDELRLEVRELTDLLRDDDSFADLRAALLGRGVTASEAILAGLIEGEDESRYGVIVTADDECIRFEADPNGSLSRWEIVNSVDELTSDFQAVSVGVAMKKRGEIS